jgi:hypothetical protein
MQRANIALVNAFNVAREGSHTLPEDSIPLGRLSHFGNGHCNKSATLLAQIYSTVEAQSHRVNIALLASRADSLRNNSERCPNEIT